MNLDVLYVLTNQDISSLENFSVTSSQTSILAPLGHVRGMFLSLTRGRYACKANPSGDVCTIDYLDYKF